VRRVSPPCLQRRCHGNKSHKLPAPSVPHPKQQLTRNRIPFSKPIANDSKRNFTGDLEYFKSEGGMSLLFFNQRGQIISTLSRSSTHLLHIGFTRA